MTNFKLVCGERYTEVLRQLLLENKMPSAKIHKGQKYILMQGTSVLGGARLVPSEDGADAIMASVCVRSRHRGLGAGKWMIDTLHDEARFQGVRNVYLGAVDSAVGFYGKFGYQGIDLESIPEEFHKALTKTKIEYASSFYPYCINQYMHLAL